MCPFSESKIANFFVDLKLLKQINNITSIGTLKNIPLMPHSFPIKLKVRSIIIGLRFNDLPINLGSKIFPTKIWIIIKNMRIIDAGKKSKNWINEKVKGNNIDRSDPRNGIKFNINAKIPKKIAKSLLKKNKIKKVKNPVIKLVSVLIWK